MMSKPSRPRGRPAQYVSDRKGKPIVGLSRMPETTSRTRKGKRLDNLQDGRYYATGTKPRIYFGHDFDLAVMRFKAWQAKQTGATVDITYDRPVSPESQRKIKQIYKCFPKLRDRPVGDIMPTTDAVPEDAFWRKVHDLIVESPRLAAQKIGIEEIGYLTKLAKPEDLALAPLLDIYLNDKSTTRDNEKVMRRSWDTFQTLTNAKSLNDISADTMVAYQDKLKTQYEGRNTEIRKHIGGVITILRHARKRGKSVTELARVIALTSVFTKPKRGKLDPRPVDRPDLESLLAVADERWTAILHLSLNGAFYGKDMAHIERSHIDIRNKTIIYRREKTDIVRVAVLWDSTIKHLKAFWKSAPSDSPYVFPNDGGHYRDAFFNEELQKLKTAAGIDNERLTFSSFRDGSATAAQLGGADSRHIDILLGHQTSMADAYILRNPHMVADACAAIEKHYFGKGKKSRGK